MGSPAGAEESNRVAAEFIKNNPDATRVDKIQAGNNRWFSKRRQSQNRVEKQHTFVGQSKSRPAGHGLQRLHAKLRGCPERRAAFSSLEEPTILTGGEGAPGRPVLID